MDQKLIGIAERGSKPDSTGEKLARASRRWFDNGAKTPGLKIRQFVAAE
jgi:hypothetical protein